MRIIVRIIIILLAALVVVGVTFAITNSTTDAQASQNIKMDDRPQSTNGNLLPGDRPEGRPEGERGGSTFGWLRHLLSISGIILVVVIIERFWGKVFKPRPVPTAVER